MGLTKDLCHLARSDLRTIRLPARILRTRLAEQLIDCIRRHPPLRSSRIPGETRGFFMSRQRHKQQPSLVFGHMTHQAARRSGADKLDQPGIRPLPAVRETLLVPGKLLISSQNNTPTLSDSMAKCNRPSSHLQCRQVQRTITVQ